MLKVQYLAELPCVYTRRLCVIQKQHYYSRTELHLSYTHSRRAVSSRTPPWTVEVSGIVFSVSEAASIVLSQRNQS
ncbi:hypothetical protein QWA68_003437 [Fusarium oxysporum]|nr:hypothetical protein QWA68_003437 [Fusarium oxysporum]